VQLDPQVRVPDCWQSVEQDWVVPRAQAKPSSTMPSQSSSAPLQTSVPVGLALAL